MSYSGPVHRKTSKVSVPRLPADQIVACEVDHTRLVNNETTPLDFFFALNEADDRSSLISAHYHILKVRCPQLIEGCVKKKKGYTINLSKTKKPISTHSNALQRVLVYLYCGQLDFSNTDPTLSVEILHIAQTFHITHLYQITKRHLYSLFNFDNVFQVLQYSAQLGLDDVKQLCYDFAMQNPDFFTLKDCRNLSFELYQEAVGILAEHYRSRETHQIPDLKVTEYNQIVDHFKDLYISKNETGDLAFVIKGKMIKAHKCILSALSTKLDEIINTVDGIVAIDEERFPRMTPQAMEDALKYFYYNQENLELLNVCYMIEFVKAMELSKLLKVLERNIAAAPFSIDSAPFLLEVGFTQLDGNPDLKQKLKERALAYVIEHMDEIDFGKFEAMPPIIATTVLIGIQKIIRSDDSSLLVPVLETVQVNSIIPHPEAGNQKLDSGKTKTKDRKSKDLRKDKRKSIFT